MRCGRSPLGNVIAKTRHKIDVAGYLYEVDVFAGKLAGLVIAELETPDQVADAELPAWLGREVTGEPAYYNADARARAADRSSNHDSAIRSSRALDVEIRRLAAPEIEKAVAELAVGCISIRPRPCTRVRKQLKWMRALFALVRPADDAFFKAENRRYRDIARSLARPRTRRRLRRDDRPLHARTIPRNANAAMSSRLRGLMAARVVGNDAMEGFDAAVNAAVRFLRSRLGSARQIPHRRRPPRRCEILRLAVGKNLKRDGALARRCRAPTADADDFHELRKAVKAHAVHVDLLAAVWPRRGADYAKSLAKLGQSLGDLHDITMVRTQLPGNTDAEIQKAIDRLLKLMRRKEKKLRKRCVAEARRLLHDRPKKVANALAANWLQAAEARLAASMTAAKDTLLDRVGRLSRPPPGERVVRLRALHAVRSRIRCGARCSRATSC